jgi:hypothetical protein
MRTLPIPPAFIENMGGTPIILQGPSSEVQNADGMHIENDGVYVLVGIEEAEREEFKKSWTFFLGFHGPVPVFSLRVNNVLTDEAEPDPEIPRLGNHQPLREEAETNWGWLYDGYGLPVGGQCYVETPEGWKLASVGDYIYFDVEKRDFWVLSNIFCNRMGWRHVPRPKPGSLTGTRKTQDTQDPTREANSE